MMSPEPNETYTHLLDAAEELFARRGYAAVTLRDIAAEVGMHHASLYYYAPGGKEQLFLQVMERSMAHHNQGLAQAIGGAGDDLRSQMHAVAAWVSHHAPLDLVRLINADLPSLPPEQAQRIARLLYDSLRLPLVAALQQARAQGVTHLADLDMAAMALLALLQTVHAIPTVHTSAERQHIANDLVDMMLDGWLAR